jgi:hypothetical protein
MSEANQEDLEHGQDHPTTTEIPEFDEMWIKSLYDKMRRSQEITQKYIQEQNNLWGAINENNK